LNDQGTRQGRIEFLLTVFQRFSFFEILPARFRRTPKQGEEETLSNKVEPASSLSPKK